MAVPHKYETVQLEDNDHSESSTEVDESVVGDDAKHWTAGTRRSRRSQTGRLASVFRSYRWMIDTVLILVSLCLLIRDQWSKQCPAPLLEIGGDYTGVRSEPFKRRITRFTSDQGYMPNNTADFFKDETLQKWNKLMPKGIGFVGVNDTSKYQNLPTQALDWGDDFGQSVYSTSVTHTLHCLYIIAWTYSGIKTGQSLPDDHHWHMVHCIDYMRNAIMCNADIALEGRETTFPESQRGGSDGWDSTHICRDYNEVLGYLESVRVEEDQVIY